MKGTLAMLWLLENGLRVEQVGGFMKWDKGCVLLAGPLNKAYV